MEIYEVMKILRHRRHVSQAKCASLINVATINYCKRERGEARFTAEEIKALLQFLQFDSGVLFEDMSFDIADKQLRSDAVTRLLNFIYNASINQVGELARVLLPTKKSEEKTQKEHFV